MKKNDNLTKTTSLPNDFVYLQDICPNIKQDIKYATTDNFTGTVVEGYQKGTAILTKAAAEKLFLVQEELSKDNLSLLIWDAYRPQRAVDFFKNWKNTPENSEIKTVYHPNLTKEEIFANGFIAKKYSQHSRGSTIDLTIINNTTSKLLDMGTIFDFFGAESFTDSTKISSDAEQNRFLLKNIMEKYGFENYYKEWWHYTLKNEPFPEKYFDFIVK
ncbi:MAG: M15 family metallopeptidase [Rickettsiaceae bacterium]|nr:M15 family metallopeptidase [Rickettsiaceae bacterium]